MIWLQLYQDIWFEDFSIFIKKANKSYINYINDYGFPMDLVKNKDHQKIYFHFLLKEVCEFIKNNNEKIIFIHNKWNEQPFHTKMIKKISKTFGIKIYEEWMPMREFIDKLQQFDIIYTIPFESFLNKETKPSSFRQIKKFLEKEGYNDLIHNYFSDTVNKMTIMC